MGTSETIGAISHDVLSSALLGKSGNLVLLNHQLDHFSTRHKQTKANKYKTILLGLRGMVKKPSFTVYGLSHAPT